MDVDAYLRRINFSSSLKANSDTLRNLHRSHMMSVPFENLDIHTGTEILLDESRFFEKIVNRNRGGFCYELNGLFAGLLREIGFDVTLCSAQVFQEERPGPEYDHLTLIVHLDEPWLADVGFGDSFLEPLGMNSAVDQVHGGIAYRISDDGEAVTLWRRKPEGKDEPQYIFNKKPRLLSEFSGMCTYHQTSPLSHFTRKRICSLAMPDGRITLSDNRLILASNGKRTERELTDFEYKVALNEHFGIDLDGSSLATSGSLA
ncbi:MAG: arylamine N-acetyltransferase [Bacteroidetes bacterium]|nr:arylamine N-acetyltransferase [Bacteroidota bacterium]MCW5895188.1 arylamine N-acetyltransferase [Bacteroidota bacterium]